MRPQFSILLGILISFVKPAAAQVCPPVKRCAAPCSMKNCVPPWTRGDFRGVPGVPNLAPCPPPSSARRGNLPISRGGCDEVTLTRFGQEEIG